MIPLFTSSPSRSLIARYLARGNVIVAPQAFDNVAWSTPNATVTANAIAAPDGSLTADQIAETVGNVEHYALQVITTTAVAWTISVFAKQFGTTRPWFRVRLDDGTTTNVGQANFNINTGVLGQAAASTGTYASASSKITALPSGWYICELVVTSSVSASARVIFYTMDSDYATNSFGGNTSHVGDASAGAYLWQAGAVAGTF